MKNNLYTKSYFIKRLKDKQLFVVPLIDYPQNDIRKWTINIEPKNYNILCTCIKESSKNFWFKFDCQQKNNIIVNTKSMETITQVIEDLIEGHKKYDQLKEQI